MPSSPELQKINNQLLLIINKFHNKTEWAMFAYICQMKNASIVK